LKIRIFQYVILVKLLSFLTCSVNGFFFLVSYFWVLVSDFTKIAVTEIDDFFISL